MWPEPLLASGFNRGKTAPGGGRGSRSPLVGTFATLSLGIADKCAIRTRSIYGVRQRHILACGYYSSN